MNYVNIRMHGATIKKLKCNIIFKRMVGKFICFFFFNFLLTLKSFLWLGFQTLLKS